MAQHDMARLGHRDSGLTRSLGRDMDFKLVEAFELLRLCLLNVVCVKVIAILMTMVCDCCGIELFAAETLSEVNTFDGVCDLVDPAILAMVFRSPCSMRELAIDFVMVGSLDCAVV